MQTGSTLFQQRLNDAQIITCIKRLFNVETTVSFCRWIYVEDAKGINVIFATFKRRKSDDVEVTTFLKRL